MISRINLPAIFTARWPICGSSLNRISCQRHGQSSLRRTLSSETPGPGGGGGGGKTPINYDEMERERWQKIHKQNRTTMFYVSAIGILTLALSFASVPLYRVYCQKTGKGGKPFRDEGEVSKIETMEKKNRKLTIHFNSDTSSRLAWMFRPTQGKLTIAPGETALAFYTAKNPLDRPIIGIATYSVQPYEAAQYLHKIQCFCFEEQQLNPKEEVDMPVFFFIDPEYVQDPRLEYIDDVILSYTFFESRDDPNVKPGQLVRPPH